MFYCYGVSEKGNTRKRNEDAFMINRIILSHSEIEGKAEKPFIVAVADGVGGENNGEKASKLSLQLLSNIKYSSKTNLKKKISDVHKNILAYGMDHEDSLNMQTTLCALAVDENGEATLINIGDSKMHKFSDGNLMQISKDQTLVQLLVDLGEITPEQAKVHSQKHVIISSLGNVEQEPEPQIEKIGIINPDDTILISTDGLSDYLSDDEIKGVLKKNIPHIKKLKELVSLAMKNGSKDNLTAVLVTGKEK